MTRAAFVFVLHFIIAAAVVTAPHRHVTHVWCNGMQRPITFDPAKIQRRWPSSPLTNDGIFLESASVLIVSFRNLMISSISRLCVCFQKGGAVFTVFILHVTFACNKLASRRRKCAPHSHTHTHTHREEGLLYFIYNKIFAAHSSIVRILNLQIMKWALTCSWLTKCEVTRRKMHDMRPVSERVHVRVVRACEFHLGIRYFSPIMLRCKSNDRHAMPFCFDLWKQRVSEILATNFTVHHGTPHASSS